MKNLLSALSAYVCMGALPARPRGVPEPEHEFPLDGTARDAVLVIDASPSMLTADWPPSRLEAAQVAASAFVKRLFANEAESRVALVAYAGNATVVFGLLPSLFFYQITAAIAGITPRQATNITAGLEAAAEILKSSEREQQVVLLSDGFHNHGPKPRSIAASLRRRATLECVGIGAGRRTWTRRC